VSKYIAVFGQRFFNGTKLPGTDYRAAFEISGLIPSITDFLSCHIWPLPHVFGKATQRNQPPTMLAPNLHIRLPVGGRL
jgi:hypothetical protein